MGSNITFRHNNIDMPVGLPGYESNSAFLFAPEIGIVNNILLESNWAFGGNYTVYLAYNPRRGRADQLQVAEQPLRPGLSLGSLDQRLSQLGHLGQRLGRHWRVDGHQQPVTRSRRPISRGRGGLETFPPPPACPRVVVAAP
jgi:hypothetical protein